MRMAEDLLGSPAVGWIGWALLHSLWQCAVIALALAITLGRMRKAAAQVRYLAACAALITMVALPAATSGLVSLAGRSVDAVGSAVSLVGKPGPIAGETDEMRAIRPRSLFLTSWLPPFVRSQTLLPRLVTVWIVGVVVLTMRLLGGWLVVRRLCRRQTRPIVGPIDEAVARLAGALGIRGGIRLLESSLVQVPMVIGGLRPVILMPIASLAGLTPRQLEALLAHELAHIRRHDYIVNLVQSAIELLLFYHPAAWWASRVIREEREHCCDDVAVRACGDRLAYARALATMEGLRGAPHLSLAASDGPLMVRVRRILNPEIISMSRFPIIGPGATLLIGVVLLAGGPALQSGSLASGDHRFEERTSSGCDLHECNVRTVFVAPFRSVSLPHQPRLQLTEIVQKEIEKRTLFKVVGKVEEADTILEGTVNVSGKNLKVENPNELPRQLGATIRVRVNWIHNPPLADARDCEPTLISAPVIFAPELGESVQDAYDGASKKIVTQIIDMGTRRFPWE